MKNSTCPRLLTTKNAGTAVSAGWIAPSVPLTSRTLLQTGSFLKLNISNCLKEGGGEDEKIVYSIDGSSFNGHSVKPLVRTRYPSGCQPNGVNQREGSNVIDYRLMDYLKEVNN